MTTLSVCLATYNEQANIGRCLDSVKDIADEIVIVDGTSTDNTVNIAKDYGANVIVRENPAVFNINKRKAIEAATSDWILLLDADEVVSKDLAQEISLVMKMNAKELSEYQESLPNRKLFLRHQHLIDQRDRVEERRGEYVAFYFPRLNYFLGHYMRYGGVYPDGVIRLFKKGKATIPGKDVHEQMEVDGAIGWLQHDLLHFDSPTFKRYLARNKRYINLMVKEFQEQRLSKDSGTLLNYCIVKPISWFFLTLIRHKGILDGWQGVVFSFFSALRFPRAFIQYLVS